VTAGAATASAGDRRCCGERRCRVAANAVFQSARQSVLGQDRVYELKVSLHERLALGVRGRVVCRRENVDEHALRFLADGRDAAFGFACDALVRLSAAGTWNVGPTEPVGELAAFCFDDVGDDAPHRRGLE
jgi:hypothetical protein